MSKTYAVDHPDGTFRGLALQDAAVVMGGMTGRPAGWVLDSICGRAVVGFESPQGDGPYVLCEEDRR